ncbi:MAG TPA: helix-turn-helix transcriptional regulator [Acetobacteraceae bacterium]|nr:helix-turn-helix transcriptional regulator [Acetobacteraceae bacterium]
MKGGWSAPFAPWVLEGWRKHSEALGGPQIVVEVTQRLLNPKETAAVARAHMTPDQLRAALHALGWSQRNLALRLDMDERQVRRWAAGEYPVPQRVADWLTGMARYADAQTAKRELYFAAHPPPRKPPV